MFEIADKVVPAGRVHPVMTVQEIKEGKALCSWLDAKQKTRREWFIFSSIEKNPPPKPPMSVFI